MRLAVLFCVLAFPAGAQTDFGAMTGAERQAFNAEMRAALMADPEIIAAALAPRNYAAEANQLAAEDDRAMLDRLSAQVLNGADIALFVSSDCAECGAAKGELEAISKSYGKTFMLHDMSSADGAALATELGLTDAPFYVLPDMILRGHMPDIVLSKYLNR